MIWALAVRFEHLRFVTRGCLNTCRSVLSTCGLRFEHLPSGFEHSWFEHLPYRFKHLRFVVRLIWVRFEHLRFVIRLIWALAVRLWALAVCDSIDLSTCHYILSTCVCDSIDLSTCHSVLSTCGLWLDWFEHLPLGFEHLRFVIRLIWALAVRLSTCGLWFDWFEHLPLGFEHFRFVIRLIWALAVRFWALAVCDSIGLSTCR